jgi:hypothetical protein
MRAQMLRDAMAEAKDFIRRGDICLKSVAHIDQGGELLHYCSPKLTGALRRQSLELTRALAELRKP